MEPSCLGEKHNQVSHLAAFVWGGGFVGNGDSVMSMLHQAAMAQCEVHVYRQSLSQGVTMKSVQQVEEIVEEARPTCVWRKRGGE